MKKPLRYLMCFTYLYCLIPYSQADVPKEYSGEWEFSVVAQKGFPWWDQIKYPVRMEISDDVASFVDQSGFKCMPKVFFYDDDLNSLVFKHCLSEKSELTFAPFYRLKRLGDQLEVEVWTFKELFKLRGRRKGINSEFKFKGTEGLSFDQSGT